MQGQILQASDIVWCAAVHNTQWQSDYTAVLRKLHLAYQESYRLVCNKAICIWHMQ